MRAGWLISAVGHVGAVLMTMHLWSKAPPVEFAPARVEVPIEVTTIGPETNLRALAIPTDNEEEPVASAPEEEEVVVPEADSEEPAPPRPQREQTRPRFNLDDADDPLVNLDRNNTPRQRDGAPADRNQAAAGLSDSEVASIEARIQSVVRRHVDRRQCWQGVADLPDPQTLAVRVVIQLNRDGSLRGTPNVISPRNTTFSPYARVAVERALRAVRVCDPFPLADDPVIGEHYEMWRELQYTFFDDH